MILSTADLGFKKILNYINWKLLLFLMLFLNVKLEVKVLAIIIIYLLQFNFKFGLRIKNSRLPLFYLLLIIIAFADLFINKSYKDWHYLPVLLYGVGSWLLCLLAIHQVKLSVENNTVEVIQNTIIVFFVINAAISFINMGLIIWETGSINPFRYQGEYQKYFIGTGDYIKGLTFDISTTNAILNAFGVIYFLNRKKPAMVLLCMVVLLLTGSNFTNLVLLLILIFLFLFKSSKDQKSLIVICLGFLIVFMAKISPQNNRYIAETYKNITHQPKPPVSKITIIKKEDSVTGPEAIKQKIAGQYLDSAYKVLVKNKLLNPTEDLSMLLPKTDQGRIVIVTNINSKSYQAPTGITPQQKKLLTFIDSNRTKLPISGKSGQNSIKPYLPPGKAMGLAQSVNFLRHHPEKLITGDGMGNFSSKLAFKVTGLGLAGKYPAKYAYISADFFPNHLDIYLNFFSKWIGYHSVINNPYSVYDQLLAEYGLVGLLVFTVFYIGFFIRHFKKLTYGIPILIIIMAAFFMDYWFEQLSVVVFFELLLLLNIKETTYLKQ